VKSWLIVIVVLVLLIAGGAWVFGDRDGRLYKKTAKLLRPLLGSPVIGQQLSVSYNGNLLDLVDDKNWFWFQPEYVSFLEEGETFSLLSRAENVWWKNWRGPFFYSYVRGDVDVSVRVSARKASSPEDQLDRGYQFGGVMLRDPMGQKVLSNENYVFNVVGYRGDALQVETKSTVGGWSDVQGHPWLSGDAELRVLRVGGKFTLFARSIGEKEWKKLVEYDRPDLPEILQVGIIAYAYSAWSGEHDLRANFEHLELKLLDHK
jgi:hypothetical protein